MKQENKSDEPIEPHEIAGKLTSDQMDELVRGLVALMRSKDKKKAEDDEGEDEEDEEA